MKLSKYEKLLAVMFFLTLPLLQPWVHGDGRGYYAFARALMFQHNLDFSLDWYKGYETDPKFAESGFRKNYETSTGHINNHWTIGPAILWSPFLISAGVVAEVVDKTTGSQFAHDGYSIPYMAGMALGTFFYGFLALLFSQRFASRFVEEKWAFLATVAIWLATSFTFYLYVEPSFSHTLSAFLVALFICEWDRTRENRTWLQWLALGAIAGLMLDTYYPNALVLLLPVSNSLFAVRNALRERAPSLLTKLAGHNLIFGVTAFFVFVPTLITKKILYGSYWSSGYKEAWYWYSPAFLKVCFSSHGMFSWTPILLFALLGLWFLRKAEQSLSFILLTTVFAFIYLIGCYQSWQGVPSFGSRFFISLFAIFVLGLGAFLRELSLIWKNRRIAIPAAATILLFTLWNFGLMFQFVTHMFPQTGEVSWTTVTYNQVALVPAQGARLLKDVLTRWAKFRPTAEPGQQRNSLMVAPHS